MGKECNHSKSLCFNFLNGGTQFALYICLNLRVLNTPTFTKSAGDHLNGKEDNVAGIQPRLPNGMALDLVKIFLCPENLLNKLMMLGRDGIGIGISGMTINTKTSSAYRLILWCSL